LAQKEHFGDYSVFMIQPRMSAVTLSQTAYILGLYYRIVLT
jgi:hypothetical protein